MSAATMAATATALVIKKNRMSLNIVASCPLKVRQTTRKAGSAASSGVRMTWYATPELDEFNIALSTLDGSSELRPRDIGPHANM